VLAGRGARGPPAAARGTAPDRVAEQLVQLGRTVQDHQAWSAEKAGEGSP
jgi:hypothetical protein